MNKKLSIAILCIDYRFWPKALPLLEAKYGEFDLVEIAGASKNIVSPFEESDRETLIENIEISIKLHNPKRIILTNHIDCGAYGGSQKFISHEYEVAFHRDQLLMAKNILSARFVGLEIETVLIDKQGDLISLQ